MDEDPRGGEEGGKMLFTARSSTEGVWCLHTHGAGRCAISVTR